MRKIYGTMAESIITNQVYTNFVSELKKMVSADRIYTDELRTLGWGTDASFYRMIPKVVVRSDTEQEVSQIVKLCSKHKLPFTFRAAGTSLSGDLPEHLLPAGFRNFSFCRSSGTDLYCFFFRGEALLSSSSLK